MHTEQGYLRPGADATAELVVVQPTGIAEVHAGTFDGRVLSLATTSVGVTRTAKPVRHVRRRFVLDGDELRYDLWMTYAHVEDGHHLQARLWRTG